MGEQAFSVGARRGRAVSGGPSSDGPSTDANVWRQRLRHPLFPFFLSLAINGLILVPLLFWRSPMPLKGADVPPKVVNVTVVAAVPPPPEPEPDPERSEELSSRPPANSAANPEAPEGQEAAQASDPAPETEPEPTPASEPEVAAAPAEDAAARAAPPPPARIRTRPAAPVIALPDVDTARGAPDGILALDCNQVFSDRDRAAECAGREVRTDWRKALIENGGDWERAMEDLRRGGAPRPLVGPDRYGGLKPGEQVYQPRDPRFDQRDFEGWRDTKRYKAFASAEERDKYLAGNDSRTYIGDTGVFQDHGTALNQPLTGWRPSWQLREDPVLDDRAIRSLVEDAPDQ